MIKKVTDQRKLPAVLVDSGNLLFDVEKIANQPSQKTITAEEMLFIYQSMGYAGVAVGPYDLSAGVDFLMASKKAGFPWLSANLLDGNKQPIFQPSLVHTVGTTHIGFIGLTGQVKNLEDSASIVPYTEVLQKEIDKLSPQCDFIVLLSSLTPKEHEEIAKSFSSVNIILSATRNSSAVRPALFQQTIIGQIKSKGKYQGLLTITPGTIPQWKTNEMLPASLENRLASYDWQLTRMKKRKKLHNERYLEKIKRIEKQREELQNRIVLLKKQIAAEKKSHKIPSTFKAELLAIQMNITPDPAIKKRLVQLKFKIKQHNKSAKEGSGLRRFLLGKKAIKNDQSILAGISACGECHKEQSTFWEKTGHAKSYQTLVKEDQNFNLDCLGCHVTTPQNPQLLGEKEKQKLLDLPASLRLVGCESCHGPGLDHIVNPQTSRPAKVVAQTCLSCHTKDHSDAFDFNSWVPRIRCPTS